MIDEETGGPAVAALDEIISAKNAVHLHEIGDPRDEPDAPRIPLLTVPVGRKIESAKPFFDEYLARPERRVGTSTLLTEKAFIDVVRRFKGQGESTVVFADPRTEAPSLLAIFDYHESGGVDDVEEGDALTGWCRHKAKLALRMSREWLAWWGVHEKSLDQTTFAAFIADHLQDCVMVDDAKDTEASEMRELLQAKVGGPSALMKLSRGLEVNQSIAVRNAITLETGEIKLQYAETQTGQGGQPITTPNLFFITIPVFYAGTAYRIPVRLRYRLAGGDVKWSFHLYRPDLVFEDAFAGVVEKVRQETDVPVFVGTPEA